MYEYSWCKLNRWRMSWCLRSRRDMFKSICAQLTKLSWRDFQIPRRLSAVTASTNLTLAHRRKITMDSSWRPPPPCRVGDPISSIDTPALIVDLDKMATNLKAMPQSMKKYPGVLVRPHGKAHKCPQVASLQVCCHEMCKQWRMSLSDYYYQGWLSPRQKGIPPLPYPWLGLMGRKREKYISAREKVGGYGRNSQMCLF